VIVGTILVLAGFTRVVLDKRRQDRDLAELRHQITALVSTREDHGDWRQNWRQLPHTAFDLSPVTSRFFAQVDAGSAESSGPTLGQDAGTAAIHEHLESLFVQDQPDAEWAERAKTIVSEKLPSLLPEGSFVRSFDCRASFCRLETSHKDQESYWKFIKGAFADRSRQLWNAETYSVPLNDDPVDGLLVSYIARENQSLPWRKLSAAE